MARILVEQTFDPALSDEECSALAQKLDPCLEVRDGIWVRSYIAADKKRCICEFEAPDAEAVREAMRSAGQAFDRVWSADLFEAGKE